MEPGHSKAALAGLERSCAAGPGPGDWMRRAPARPGFERYEARFAGQAFARHRHDTYAIGITLQGVQAFGYRGGAAVSLAGQAMILHPDEPHDGRAGSEAGFRYRILYADPALIRRALGESRRPLPFVPGGVSADPRLRAVLLAALDDLERPLEDLEADALIQGLAEALAALDPASLAVGPGRLETRGLERARALLVEHLERPLGSAALEAASGLDRYRLARQFRARFGTSPHRYRSQRRLERVRGLIEDGLPLAEAALSCGFADQSHMNRHFKKTYGLPPGRWAALARAGGRHAGGRLTAPAPGSR